MSDFKYELKAFSSDSMGATRKSWLRTIDGAPADFDRNLFETKLDLAAANMDYSAEEASYGIFEGKSNVAAAYVDINCQRSGKKWIKMMNLQLSPSLDLSVDKNAPNFAALAELFAAAILGTLKLTSAHKARVVKLYARSTVLLEFFKFVAGSLGTKLKAAGGNAVKVKIVIEGRWLVFTF